MHTGNATPVLPGEQERSAIHAGEATAQSACGRGVFEVLGGRGRIGYTTRGWSPVKRRQEPGDEPGVLSSLSVSPSWLWPNA